MKEYRPTHEHDNQRFVIVTDEGESELTYQLDGNTVDFDHTFVHPGNRGSKVGFTLVNTAVSWAEAQGYRMVASCWYVRRFLDKHR